MAICNLQSIYSTKSMETVGICVGLASLLAQTDGSSIISICSQEHRILSPQVLSRIWLYLRKSRSPASLILPGSLCCQSKTAKCSWHPSIHSPLYRGAEYPGCDWMIILGRPVTLLSKLQVAHSDRNTWAIITSQAPSSSEQKRYSESRSLTYPYQEYLFRYSSQKRDEAIKSESPIGLRQVTLLGQNMESTEK